MSSLQNEQGDDLNVLSMSDDVPEDMVILDEKLRAREAARREALTSPEEVPQVENQSNEEDVGEEATNDEVYAGEARSAPSVLTVVSDRDSMRLLIFTKSVSILSTESFLQRRLLEWSGLFAEIHVVVLSLKADGEPVTMRLTDNVWMYTTSSSGMIMASYDAYKVAERELAFAGGFRADMIVAEDPFESGIAAYLTAKKFERPIQVHILEDIFDPEFLAADPHNHVRMYAARFLLKRITCVRTASEGVLARLVEAYPRFGEGGGETLPMYHDLSFWRDMPPEYDLKERYPQFKFIILHVSSMHPRSHTIDVVNGVAPLLRMYPTVGLVIVGSGPLRQHIEKHVSELGIAGRIVFEPTQSNIISHMKTAHVLVQISEDPEEDLTILEAASVKLPIIGLKAGLAGSLFTTGESAFLCDAPEAGYVGHFLRMYLNDNTARMQYALTAQEIVFERVEQDYEAYLRAYRASIERCA